MTEIIEVNAAAFPAYAVGLAALMQDCVDNGASVNFLAPITIEEAGVFWQERFAPSLESGDARLFVALDDEQAVVGCIVLMKAWQPNAPHRAEVQKMLVHSAARRQGIATALMRTLEAAARDENRWILFLDTEAGSGAEGFYVSAGYTRFGVMPKHALDATGSSYGDTAFYYKDLSDWDAS